MNKLRLNKVKEFSRATVLLSRDVRFESLVQDSNPVLFNH